MLDTINASAERQLPEEFVTIGWMGVLSGLPPAILGALLIRSRPRHAVGWVLTIFGVVWLVDMFAGEWATHGALSAPDAPGISFADWFYSRFGAWLLPLQALVVVVFPDGRLPADRWWRRGTVAGLILVSITPLALMVAPLSALAVFDNAHSPELEAVAVDLIVLPLPDSVWESILWIGRGTLLASLLVPLAVTVHRYRRGSAEQRAQLRWLIWAVLVSVIVMGIGLPLPGFWGELPFPLSIGLTCAAIAMAVSRHRLYDIDRLLPSTLVYATMAVVFLLVDMLVIAAAGHLVGERDAALVAMALVAVVYGVARDWLWRLSRRLLLGVRPDSHRTVSTLARQLESAASPQEQLRNLARTVARELRLPYVLVEVDGDGGGRVTVTHGQPTAHLMDLPVAYRGERIGRLVLGTRRRAHLRASDQTLIGDLVRQAAAAARATEQAAALQRARIGLVTAREEERRRLRRDLHDGLGPTIAMAAMRVKTARHLAATKPAQADQLLDQSVTALGTLMEDVRRLVYEMRPPALDELGLAAALAPQIDTLRQAGVAVTLDVPDPLPRLPAACEVAAYRIVAEALTNVARHSQARRCRLTIRPATDAAYCGHVLEVVVTDDGVGLPASAPAGVGLLSIRERATELGGGCDVSRAAAGGVQVRCLLPYAAEPAEVTARA